MIRNPLVVLALFLSSASLPGCSFVRDSVIDSVAGAPVTNVAKDVKATSDEYEKGQSEKRAEELSKDYEDFLRSRDAPSGCENETTQSVMIQCGTNERE